MSEVYPHQYQMLTDRTTPSGKILYVCRCGAETPAPVKPRFDTDCPAAAAENPPNTKAWRIDLDGQGMWVDEPDAVARECIIDGDEDNGYHFTVEQVAAMNPGDVLKSEEWTVSCRMVPRPWLHSLPEHTGW